MSPADREGWSAARGGSRVKRKSREVACSRSGPDNGRETSTGVWARPGSGATSFPQRGRGWEDSGRVAATRHQALAREAVSCRCQTAWKERSCPPAAEESISRAVARKQARGHDGPRPATWRNQARGAPLPSKRNECGGFARLKGLASTLFSSAPAYRLENSSVYGEPRCVCGSRRVRELRAFPAPTHAECTWCRAIYFADGSARGW